MFHESKYRKVVNKFRQKLATKDATQLLSPNHQSLASHSPRMNSAYRIMSGNASVSSGGGGGGAEWNVLNYVKINYLKIFCKRTYFLLNFI